MPSEQQALQYFEFFFEHIHPYVPVINKLYFYQQWHTNRDSISPLILEAIFACAGYLSEDPTQGSRWLALASSMPHPIPTWYLHSLTFQNTPIALWMCQD